MRDPALSDPRLQEARSALRQGQAPVRLAEALVAHHPASAVAWSTLADAWAARGELAAVLRARREAVARAPDAPTLHYNLGTTLLAMRQRREAVAALSRAVALAPGLGAAQMNLGVALRELGRLDEAAAVLASVAAPEGSELEAEVAWNRSLVLRMQGHRGLGLELYEARLKLPRFSLPVPRGLPLWTGGDVDGLLVVAEQGLGDTLQFSRFIRRLTGVAARVVFAVQRPLVPLLSAGLDGLRPQDQVVALSRQLDVPQCTAWVPLLSLPQRLGVHTEALDAESSPWLSADPELVESWRERLGVLPGTRKVGIVWQGNPSYRDDVGRSVPLAHYAPLAAIDGVTLVSLQKRHGREQLRRLPPGMAVVDLNNRLDEDTGPFLDTAAVMRVLDAVVTSDTATLHLAGALGVPCSAAIAHLPDWRFGTTGDRLPEYPCTRLVRQQQPGDWAGVFADIAAGLDG